MKDGRYEHLEYLVPEEAIPDRYLESQKPKPKLVDLVIEFAYKYSFIAYPTPSTLESRAEAEANSKDIERLMAEIKATGYTGSFCKSLYGYVILVEIDFEEEDTYNQIKINWKHLL